MALDPEAGSYTAVVGLGVTGLACVRHLRRRGERVIVLDSRADPPGRVTLQRDHPEVEMVLGKLDRRTLFAADQVVVSPGLDLRYGVLSELRNLDGKLLGELTLFAEALAGGASDPVERAKVVAVTGSNGKSTVVSLLADMAREAGFRVALGGNLGTPALELLEAGQADIYILEVSSFQLEACPGFRPDVAAVLNVSADHMDRYADIDHYAATKARLLQGVELAVINADDPRVLAMGRDARQVMGFSLVNPAQPYHCLNGEGGKGGDSGNGSNSADSLVACGEPLLEVSEMRLAGRANQANGLAAMALADACRVPREAQIRGLRSFAGLPHRMERIGKWRGVEWINDSKATNVGAALAALSGLDSPVVLIAGGQGKGADFRPLGEACVERARAVVVLGEDGAAIEAAIAGRVAVEQVADLPRAVEVAADLARPGDSVLLAPACASFDAFSGFAQRGEVFRNAVLGEGANHG